MYCLRCGRETQDDHTFCDSCLETMEKYPVRPGTAVMLPRRTENGSIKKTKRHLPPSPMEQIKKLKKQRAWLITAVLVLVLALLASSAAGIHFARSHGLRPGQNYSAADTTEAS